MRKIDTDKINYTLLEKLSDNSLYAVPQIAEVLGTSDDTVRNYFKAGELQGEAHRSGVFTFRMIYGGSVKTFVKKILQEKEDRKNGKAPYRPRKGMPLPEIDEASPDDPFSKQCPVCHRYFIPRLGTQIYCSRRCSQHGCTDKKPQEDVAPAVTVEQEEQLQAEVDDLAKKIWELENSLDGQSIERQMQIIKEIQELSAKRAEIAEDADPVDATEPHDVVDAYGAVEELRVDAGNADAALSARLDAIEARLNKGIYDLWLSHVCTLDAFSDCFVPFMNSKANSLRLGAEFDAKFAGFKLPPKEERKKLMENRTQN